MTTPADVLLIASRQIGYRESPPGSNQNKFGVWYKCNYQPWCAMFVSYCFYLAGLPLPATTAKGFAYCPYGVQWFRHQGKFDKQPRVGDVAFFDWRGDGIADHVGIVESVNNDGSVTTIEGNTSMGNNSNGGEVQRRVRSLGSIQGFGHPGYNGVSSRGGTKLSPYPSWPGKMIQLSSPPTASQDIVKWQQQMIFRGWSLAATGIFDQRSHEILKQFQQEKQLEVDGILGPTSWNASWELPITSS